MGFFFPFFFLFVNEPYALEEPLEREKTSRRRGVTVAARFAASESYLEETFAVGATE